MSLNDETKEVENGESFDIFWSAKKFFITAVCQYGWAGEVRDICCLHVPAVYLSPLGPIRE